MPHRSQGHRETRQQIQLFLEETVTDVLRRELAVEAGVSVDAVTIEREVFLSPGVYADARVEAPGHPPVFVEVKEEHDAWLWL